MQLGMGYDKTFCWGFAILFKSQPAVGPGKYCFHSSFHYMHSLVELNKIVTECYHDLFIFHELIPHDVITSARWRLLDDSLYKKNNELRQFLLLIMWCSPISVAVHDPN